VRKYLNYVIFGAVILVVVGLAVNHSRHVKSLVTSLVSGQPAARAAAATELIQTEQFMDSINGETVETRLGAVEALEVTETPAAVKQLLPLLKDQDKSVQARAIVALQKIGAKTPDNLKEMLAGLKDGDTNIRKNSILAFDDPKNGFGPTSGVVAGIVAYMKAEGGARGPGGDVLSSPLFLQKNSQTESVPLLLALIDDKDEGVRGGAIEALGKIGDKAAIPRLITAMQKDTPQTRRVAIGAIALIADVSGEAALTEAVGNPEDNNEARAQAAIGLGKIGTPTAVSTLIKTLKDDDLKLRSAAVVALVRAGRPTPASAPIPMVLAALSEATKSTDESTALGAVGALQGIEAPQTNGTLLALLDKPGISDELRVATTKALGFTGNKEAVSKLLGLLSDATGSSDAVGTAAQESLTKIGPEAAEPLIAAMSQNDTLGYQVATVLAKQGTSVLPALERGLQTADAAKQRWIAVAMGEMGVAEVRPSLETLAKSPNAEVAFVAKEQLNRMGLTQIP